MTLEITCLLIGYIVFDRHIIYLKFRSRPNFPRCPQPSLQSPMASLAEISLEALELVLLR